METNTVQVVPDRLTLQMNVYHEHHQRQPLQCTTYFSRQVPPNAVQRLDLSLGTQWAPVPVPCTVGDRSDWWEEYHLTIHLQTTDTGAAESRVGEEGPSLYAHGGGGVVFATVRGIHTVYVRGYSKATAVSLLVCASRVE